MAPAVNWTGMTPEDVFDSLSKAPKVVRWSDGSGRYEGIQVAFDPHGHQVAVVGRPVRHDLDWNTEQRGFYVSVDVAEAQLRADGYIIVNPAT